MFILQASQLQRHKEQEEADRQGGVQEVLPLVQQAYAAQGNKVTALGSLARLGTPRRERYCIGEPAALVTQAVRQPSPRPAD